MTAIKKATTCSQKANLLMRMLAGAGTGLGIICLFLLAADKGNLEWDRLWMLRPLTLVPLAGAMAGWCNYLLMQWYQQFGISKTVALLGSMVVAVTGLFLGMVLGLDGTMWH